MISPHSVHMQCHAALKAATLLCSCFNMADHSLLLLPPKTSSENNPSIPHCLHPCSTAAFTVILVHCCITHFCRLQISGIVWNHPTLNCGSTNGQNPHRTPLNYYWGRSAAVSYERFPQSHQQEAHTVKQLLAVLCQSQWRLSLITKSVYSTRHGQTCCHILPVD